MTTKTTIHCDRCSIDITDVTFWQFGVYEVATAQEFSVTKGDRIDLCVRCKRALDNFLRPVDQAAP